MLCVCRDNYGFITYTKSDDATTAIENGNKDQELQYDLCFGGRRQFCRQQYTDLGKTGEI